MSETLPLAPVPVGAGPLAITVATQGDRCRLRVCGGVDLATAELVSDAIGAVLHERPAHLDVDLSGVTFLDSTGLRAFIRITWDAQRTSTELAFVAVPPLVQRLLHLTGLWRILPVASTSDDQPNRRL